MTNKGKMRAEQQQELSSDSTIESLLRREKKREPQKQEENKTQSGRNQLNIFPLKDFQALLLKDPRALMAPALSTY